MPVFVFSLALVNQKTGLPVLGIINDPIMKNMYFATKGGGAFRNQNKIEVSKDSTLKNTYFNTASSEKKLGFSHLVLFKELSEIACKVMKYPSFIYGAIQVANGKYSGLYFILKKGTILQL